MALQYKDEQFDQKAVQNFLEDFILPEVNKRMDMGLLPKDFHLKTAQLLMHTDLNNIINLNNEVVGLNGAPSLESFKLPIEYLDYGHITVCKNNDLYSMIFDLRYNKMKTINYPTVIKGYIESAHDCLKKNNIIPLLDDLFYAYELLFKAHLKTMPAPHQAESHQTIHSQINLRSKRITALAPFVRVYNKLYDERDKIRYGMNHSKFSTPEIHEMIKLAEKLFDQLIKILKI